MEPEFAALFAIDWAAEPGHPRNADLAVSGEGAAEIRS
jgi:hypothetical protein